MNDDPKTSLPQPAGRPVMSEGIHPGTVCRHHSGRVYTVLLLANKESTRDKFPLTVVYIGANGNVWSRPYKEFVEKFTVLYDGNNLAAAAGGNVAVSAEILARALYLAECEEENEVIRRAGKEPPEKWADPWDPNGGGQRQRAMWLRRARAVNAALARLDDKEE